MKSIKCQECGLVNRSEATACLRCKTALHQITDAQQSDDVVADTIGWETTMERPFWVKVGLWGLGTRTLAFAFFVLSILLATGLCLYWSWTGALIYLAAAWYWFAIRWVDKNDRW